MDFMFYGWMDEKIKEALEVIGRIERAAEKIEAIAETINSDSKGEKKKQRDIPVIEISIGSDSEVSIDRKDAGVLLRIKNINGTSKTLFANEWVGENAIKEETW